LLHISQQSSSLSNKAKSLKQGLKIKDTPIFKGEQIFHNFTREHEALEGKTPADKAGIEVLGENKW